MRHLIELEVCLFFCSGAYTQNLSEKASLFINDRQETKQNKTKTKPLCSAPQSEQLQESVCCLVNLDLTDSARVALDMTKVSCVPIAST